MARTQPRQDTGNLGYREPGDSEDGRRVIRRGAFWASESERLEYEHAVEETRDMLPSQRLEAIRLKFGKGGIRRMPRARQSRQERDVELRKLRAQVDEGDAEVDWWKR